ncbi:hypothetical protein F5Y12DRAFT_717618 [Xylaria sp. FL1777]|nr:hypothetical protein F5Y12DRAFT_717618 [Xylaria sp. FL1777]
MSRSHEVQALYKIADNINSRSAPRISISHDAKSLFKLIKKSSLAVRNPHSNERRMLVDCYRRCQDLGVDPILNRDLICDGIYEFMIRIDDLFFFSTLTREVSGSKGRRDLVNLRISKTPNSKLYGQFDHDSRRIKIWLGGYDEAGRYEPFPIERVLFTVAHEMTHGFLFCFSDQSHPRHDEWVEEDQGHGKMFCEIIDFIGEIITEFTNSPLWQRERIIGHCGPPELTPELILDPPPFPGYSGGLGHTTWAPSRSRHRGPPIFSPYGPLDYPPIPPPEFYPGDHLGFSPYGAPF